KKVTTYGNKLFETIPHEEWGLKSVPPLSQRRKSEELQGRQDVEVNFPAALIDEEGVKEALKAFAGRERQRFHTKWMWWSIGGIPATARAGSQHLDFLLGRRLFKFRSSSELDIGYGLSELYREVDASIKKNEQQLAGVKESDETTISTKDPRAERLLLTRSSGKVIADLVGVPELEEQVHRAVKQVERALRTNKPKDIKNQDLHKPKEEDKTTR
ncbi:MAG: hypothetical protein Q9174_004941, partial [Haloplaca sp. 1 TL-2023]